MPKIAATTAWNSTPPDPPDLSCINIQDQDTEEPIQRGSTWVIHTLLFDLFWDAFYAMVMCRVVVNWSWRNQDCEYALVNICIFRSF
ncbi:unnamed protein product [Arabidopsis arenosa]|uniref:Uncharacterized protein n=1 Tax=Arabidopsis arenosa TaxID=38785 RepID=A0A8S2AFX4_ARAAE|nr:unnamed protein product [Arabidopsis arenosa]